MKHDEDCPMLEPASFGTMGNECSCGWLPIETAPRDGTVVELLGENGKLDMGEWCEWSEHFDKTANEISEDVTGEFSTEYGEGPHTHWRPLPSNALAQADAACGVSPGAEC